MSPELLIAELNAHSAALLKFVEGANFVEAPSAIVEKICDLARQRSDKFRDGQHLWRWMLMQVRNYSQHEQRKAQRQRSLDCKHFQASYSEVDAAAIEDVGDDQQLAFASYDLVAPDDQALLFQRKLLNLRYKEISGTPQSNSRSRVSRALERCRDSIVELSCLRQQRKYSGVYYMLTEGLDARIHCAANLTKLHADVYPNPAVLRNHFLHGFFRVCSSYRLLTDMREVLRDHREKAEMIIVAESNDVLLAVVERLICKRNNRSVVDSILRRFEQETMKYGRWTEVARKGAKARLEAALLYGFDGILIRFYMLMDGIERNGLARYDDLKLMPYVEQIVKLGNGTSAEWSGTRLEPAT